MYIYIQSEKTLWTVGFYDPNGEWNAESDWPNKYAAVARTAYLNGQSKPNSDPVLTPADEPGTIHITLNKNTTGVEQANAEFYTNENKAHLRDRLQRLYADYLESARKLEDELRRISNAGCDQVFIGYVDGDWYWRWDNRWFTEGRGKITPTRLILDDNDPAL